MMKMTPLPVDDEALTAGAEQMERQVLGMKRNLEQYQPSISLTSEGRLMYALAQDPNAQTFHVYPTGGYAKPLKPDTIAGPHRLRRAAATARRVITHVSPFAPQDVPGPNATSLRGHVIPLGFMAAQGLDVCWNGRGWTVTPGEFRFSTQIAEMNEEDNVSFPQQVFAPLTGMICAAFTVAMIPDEPEPPFGRLRIVDTEIRFEQGQDRIEIKTDATFAEDPGTGEFSFDEVISPIAYVLAPTAKRPAPVVLTLGNGVFPTGRSFTIPTPDSTAGAFPIDP